GGASGIGRALCGELARRGATVVVADLDETGAKAVTSAITGTGGKALAVKTDVTKFEEVSDLVNTAIREFGRLDYLFNNAGVGVGGEARDMDLSHWKFVLDVNLWGVIHGVHAAYPVMIRQGFGHIVNTASMAGLIPTPGEISYTASKFAVVGLSRVLRIEARDLGVKVSAVCPGFVDTAIFKVSPMLNSDVEELLEKLPIKMTSPDKVALHILTGVEKNREIIFATNHAKPLYLFNRHLPRLYDLLTRKIARDIRKTRKVS
ncbi:MAG: SDR family oxidoreductase, partial [Proteobacteria bacterium]|nr:SDR family oxidoreductase [Pseudomonadota bacterium]